MFQFTKLKEKLSSLNPNNNNTVAQDIYNLSAFHTEEIQYTLQGLFKYVNNTKFEEAEKYFQQAPNPNNLWILMGRAENQFWKALFSESATETKKAVGFIEPITNLISPFTTGYKRRYVKGEFRKWFTNPNSYEETQFKKQELECMIIAAQLTLSQSMLEGKNQNWMKAAYYFRKSWKWFSRSEWAIQELEKLNHTVPVELSGIVDFGIGVFNFIMSLVPPILQWFTTFMGFNQSNRQVAYKALDRSWKSGCSRSINAALMLHWLEFLLLGNSEKSDQILKEMSALYPSSALVSITVAYYKQIQGKMDESVLAFDETIKVSSEVKMTQLAATYLQGECFYLQNKWQETLDRTLQFFQAAETKETPYFKCNGSFKVAVCYWFLNQKDKIPEWIKQVEIYQKEGYEHDLMVTRLARKLQANQFQFTKFDEFYILLMNLTTGGLYKEAQDVYSAYDFSNYKCSESETQLEVEAWSKYFKGLIDMGLGEREAARKMFQEVIKMEVDIQNSSSAYTITLVPHSLVSIAEIDLKKKAYWAASEQLTRAQSFKNYEFEKILFVRLKRLLIVIDDAQL